MRHVEDFVPGFIDFQHVTVSVTDVNRSLAFYRDLPGFPVLGRLNYVDMGLSIDFLDIGNNGLLEVFCTANVPARPTETIPNDL